MRFSSVRKILMISTFAILFTAFSINCYAHTPNPYTKESKFLIAKPVIDLHSETSQESSYVSQGIYGHSVHVVSEMSNGWALIETEDGYQGYALLANLTPDNPRWKTSKRLARVSSVCGMVYPIADNENPALLRLPFGSRVELVEDFNSNDNRWLKVNLLDGSVAWMQRGDLELLNVKSLDKMVELSHKFLERPYIWGGTSSEGFDCSGFVQTLCKQMGVLLPRDSRPQSESEKVTAIEYPDLPGDLVFFGETRITHVGLLSSEGVFIHSGVKDNNPKIALTKLDSSAYKMLAARRLKPVAFQATISSMDDVISRMPHSWKDNNPVSLENLRHIKLNHWGFDGCLHNGELVVHELVADDVVAIFRELFESRYPIEKMLLIDAYQANDTLSCEDNNTSAFCSRPITGGTSTCNKYKYPKRQKGSPIHNFPLF